MEKKQLILVGDVIKSSKKFKPKEWENFQLSIETVNQKFAGELIIPFIVYSGDSFGAVCSNIAKATEMVFTLQESQKYQKSRFVLIEDEITYGMEQKNFLTLEGPALWKSEEQLTLLKKSKQFFATDLANPLLSLTVSTIVNLILSVRNDWNEQEWNIYRNYHSNVKQKDLADELGITQQYVSKIIRQSKLRLIKEAEENLKIIIDGIHTNIH